MVVYQGDYCVLLSVGVSRNVQGIVRASLCSNMRMPAASMAWKVEARFGGPPKLIFEV